MKKVIASFLLFVSSVVFGSETENTMCSSDMFPEADFYIMTVAEHYIDVNDIEQTKYYTSLVPMKFYDVDNRLVDPNYDYFVLYCNSNVMFGADPVNIMYQFENGKWIWFPMD